MSGGSRPTWNPATGSALAPTMQYSSRDLKGHSKLKLRHDLDQHIGSAKSDQISSKLLLSTTRNTVNPESDSESKVTDVDSHKEETTLPGEKDDVLESDDDTASNESVPDDDEYDIDRDSDIDEGEDDETEALMQELAKIKREREIERLRKEHEEREARLQTAKHSNPLLLDGHKKASFAVKRRWDDEVVFKHQKKGDGLEKPKKRFVNDTLRSDFHKDFLNRYIK